MAERGGFEPPVRFPVRRFSKPVLSATQSPLRMLRWSYSIAQSHEASSSKIKKYKINVFPAVIPHSAYLTLLAQIISDILTRSHALKFFKDTGKIVTTGKSTCQRGVNNGILVMY